MLVPRIRRLFVPLSAWLLLIFLFVEGVVGAGAAAPDAHADLVLRGGRVVTVDAALPEAQAVAMRGTKILAVGSDEEIAALIGSGTRVIDLGGRLVIPGFIEGHGHFVGLGEAQMNLNLLHAESWQEVIEVVAEAVRRAQSGEWIVGRGWHQEKWNRSPGPTVEGFPLHDALSEISPDNPVVLTHASGHLSFANRRAMELSGISAATEDPAGGEILRDAGGQPIGIFRQNAQRLVQSREPSMSPRARFERLDRAIDLAVRECLRNGVTSFQDAGSTFPVIDRLAERAREGTLGVRLWMMIRTGIDEMESHAHRYRPIRRIGDDRLTVGGIKFAIDGALGSRGAWLLEPYTDSPQSAGFNTTPLEVLARAARLALETDLQLCIHAIGDRANREVLDLYERAFSEWEAGEAADSKAPPGIQRRWRIEHAQHLHPHDIPRFAQLGVIASMQGVHCTSDGPWVYDRLGEERARTGAYVWRSLLDSGAIVSNGSDAPVEELDPIPSFYASVTRALGDGAFFFPEQRMTRMEALRSYTIDAARAAFEEDIKGSLTPGKLADIVVLSADILRVPDDRIRDARVDLTILGGEVVFDRGQDAS